MKVEEAAKILGCSALFVRCGIKEGTLPIGAAVRMHGKNRWRYLVIDAKVYEFAGKKMPEANPVEA